MKPDTENQMAGEMMMLLKFSKNEKLFMSFLSPPFVLPRNFFCCLENYEKDNLAFVL